MMWAVAILTMVVGSLVAITQTDVKRMLAYCSIAHAGFILTGLVATDAGWPTARSSASRACCSTCWPTASRRSAPSRSSRWSATRRARRRTSRSGPAWPGARRSSRCVFALFLAAFAGIPLTSGFTGKFAVFAAAVEGGRAPLVVVGVVASAVAAFFYFRVIVLMFFSAPAPEGPPWPCRACSPPWPSRVGVVVTVVLGVWPTEVLDLAGQLVAVRPLTS